MNTTQMIGYLSTPAALEALTAIYPGDAPRQAARYRALAETHRARFGEAEGLLFASARGARRCRQPLRPQHGGVWPPPSNGTLAAASNARHAGSR
jgi:hypothetical protein